MGACIPNKKTFKNSSGRTFACDQGKALFTQGKNNLPPCEESVCSNTK